MESKSVNRYHKSEPSSSPEDFAAKVQYNMKKMIQQSGCQFGWKPVNVKPAVIKNGFYGPREWQKRAFKSLKDALYAILNAPMGSGKSWEMCLLSAHKLEQDPKLRCIIAVPQTIIASGFEEANLLMPDGRKVEWVPQHNLCMEYPTDEGTISYVINFLRTPHRVFNDRILICTHQTITAVYKRLKKNKQLKLLHNLLCWIDEAHHLQNNEIAGVEDAVISNELGEFVAYLVRHGKNVHLGLATASFFRGDRLSLLTPKMEEEFARFNLPYDEYLKSMEHLRSFSFDFLLCGPDYSKGMGKILKGKKRKDIIYIPHPISRHSTGNKYAEVNEIIKQYRTKHKGKVWDLDNGLTIIQKQRGSFKILDLVDEDRRKEKKEYVSKIAERKDLDAIIALGMFKEGANWIWAERSIIVGPRASLVDVVQMIGRLFRDAPGKEHVQVIQLLPFSLDQVVDKTVFRENLNDYLKAIYSCLILENILHPVQIISPQPQKGSGSSQGQSASPNWLGTLLPDDAKQRSLIEEVATNLIEIAGPDNINITDLWDEYQEILPEILDSYGIAEHVVDIGNEIWAMLVRPTLQLQGIDVNNISFDIIKETNPLEGLVRYTSDVCGIKTFQNLRVAISSNEAQFKKEELIQLAKDGAVRPQRGMHPLSMPLKTYTTLSSSAYDPVFDKKIKALRPDWFSPAVPELRNTKKQQLFDLAKNGADRPRQRRHPLGESIYHYTRETSPSYDPVFDKQIRGLRPDWFISPVDQKKQQLLDLAKSGADRPQKNKSHLGNCFFSYTNKRSKAYDAAFVKKLEQLRPDWLISRTERANSKQQQLLKLAKNGADRPVQGKHSLAMTLKMYTKKSSVSYDADFCTQIKALRPDWFISRTEIADHKKRELIKLAKDGLNRPRLKKDPLGSVLSHYTTNCSGTYDAEFDRKIRNLRPDWFARK